jgi:hypothetical protein
MKKILLGMLMFCSASLFAQSPLDHYNSPFHNNGSSVMLAPISLFNTGWDDTSATVALGFDFKWNEILVDSVTINSNGFVELEDAGILILFGIDFTDRVNVGQQFTSPIEYELDSVTDTNDPKFGAKMIKINYNGVRFKGSGDSNYVNTTMILYDNHIVEYYYGSSHVDPGLYGPSQLNTSPSSAYGYKVSGTTYNWLTAKGSVQSPGWEEQFGLMGPTPLSPPWYPIGGLSGNRYTMVPLNVGMKDVTGTFKLEVYPNPANNEVNIKTDLSGKSYQVGIYDIVGKEVYSSTATAGNHTVDVSNLSTGLYTVKITTEKGQTARKLVIE